MSPTSPMFGTATYAYDIRDNLTQVIVSGGTAARSHYYRYNAANQLRKRCQGQLARIHNTQGPHRCGHCCLRGIVVRLLMRGDDRIRIQYLEKSVRDN